MSIPHFPLHLTCGNDAAELVYGMDNDSIARLLGQQVKLLISTWTYDAVQSWLIVAACSNLRNWEISSTSLVGQDVIDIARHRPLLLGVRELKLHSPKYLTMGAISRLISYMPHLRRLHLMSPAKRSLNEKDLPDLRALRLESFTYEGISNDWRALLLPLHQAQDTLRVLSITFTSSDGISMRDALAEILQTQPFRRLTHLRLAFDYTQAGERYFAAHLLSACPNLRVLDTRITFDSKRDPPILVNYPRGLRELVLRSTNRLHNIGTENAGLLGQMESGDLPNLRRLTVPYRREYAGVDTLALQAYCRKRRIRLILVSS